MSNIPIPGYLDGMPSGYRIRAGMMQFATTAGFVDVCSPLHVVAKAQTAAGWSIVVELFDPGGRLQRVSILAGLMVSHPGNVLGDLVYRGLCLADLSRPTKLRTLDLLMQWRPALILRAHRLEGPIRSICDDTWAELCVGAQP